MNELSYYEQMKLIECPKLIYRYKNALETDDYNEIEKIYSIVYDNKRLNKFEKKMMWDIITRVKKLN